MADPFLGEIRPVSFTYAPKGWAKCDGTLLSRAQNNALFSLIGTTYGGGATTFGLPDLRGRLPVHFSASLPVATLAGAETVAITTGELPVHTHGVAASSGPAAVLKAEEGGVPATSGTPTYAPAGAAVVSLAPASSGVTGSGAPHDNVMPYAVIPFIIALQGIFPAKD